MKKNIIFLIFIIISTLAYSYDFEAVIHQRMVNYFLEATGELSGKTKIKLFGISQNVRWKLRNINLEIKKDKAVIKGDFVVKIAGEDTKSLFLADADIFYNKLKDVIEIKIVNASLEGIEFLNVSNLFNQNIIVPIGKKEEVFQIEMLDGTKKDVKIIIKDRELSLEDKKIILKTDVEFDKVTK